MTDDPSIVASDPNLSAWVAANAGSGKTYTLANRVTRLLLEGAKPERILCLTYTKAAAAEMQGRLFAQLGEWAMLSDDALRVKIAKIGGAAGAGEDLRKARRLFAQALETPGGLKIQTIHAFCQTLLSRFPLEAGVPPAFAVLDEQSAREAMAQARARVLEQAGGSDAALSAAIAHLATQLAESTLNSILDTALGNDRRKLERFFASYEGTLGAAIRRSHGLDDEDSADAIVAEFCAMVRDEAETLRAIAAWLDGGGTKDKERAGALRAALAQDREEAAIAAFCDALLTKDRVPHAHLAAKALVAARPDLAAAFRNFIDRFCKIEDRYRAALCAELCEATLTIAEAVSREYKAAKRARSVLDYDDLIAETKALLEERDAAAWVLYKLDGGIDHVLIDEAQDTSPEQWAIVQKLTEEFFAGAGARSEATRRTIFAVGDEKQSIFSFQGADPARFDANRRHFYERAIGAGLAFVHQPLVTSRRSAPEILGFVDAVFSAEDARAGLTSDGSAIRHEAHRAEAKGRVEFWPALKPPQKPETDYWRPVDTVSKDSAVSRLATEIAERIHQWIDKRVRLDGHEHPIRPGDIMILLPRREPFGSEIIRKLKERNIPVAGADRIRLTEQIAVMDLVALGRFALLPEDDLTLAALLRSPLCGLSEEQLFTLCHGRARTVWDALAARKNDDAFSGAYGFLSEMRARADFAPPYEFYAHALSARGMREKLTARLGPEAGDAIAEFLALAFSYEKQSPPSLEGFLHWIGQGAEEIKRDMERGRDEVRVMTVHGAKGLEADIVILPDTTTLPEQPSQKGHLLYTDDGILFPRSAKLSPARVQAAKDAAEEEAMREHRRLFYVALTRARDRLYICGFENRNGRKRGSWHELAERAARTLGAEFDREAGKGFVVGETGEQFGLAVEKPAPAATVAAWARTKPAAEPKFPRLIQPSEAADGPEPAVLSPLAEGGSDRFRRGVLVHALLAHLPELARAQRSDAAIRFLTARGLAQCDAEEVAALTLAVLDDPQFAPAFIASSVAEAAITAELPEIAPGARISGRIDRLAVTDEEVLLVDYKTNRPPPVREEDVAELYIGQMALYRAAAAKIFPGRRIGCALVWTEGPRLMPLSDARLDAQIGRIRARLDPQGPHS